MLRASQLVEDQTELYDELTDAVSKGLMTTGEAADVLMFDKWLRRPWWARLLLGGFKFKAPWTLG